MSKPSNFECCLAQWFALLLCQQYRKLFFVPAEEIDRLAQDIRASGLSPIAPISERLMRDIDCVAGILGGCARRRIHRLAGSGIHHFDQFTTSRADPLAADKHL